ncbi:MAG TPA: ATP-binding protein [Candidatus Methylomirabilis sp.]
MRFPFLDRREELTRLQRLFRHRHRGVGVRYGRRRCGKSRLLLEALPAGRAVYYVADDRESPLQRVAVATELARLLPGFDRVTYPDWDALLTQAWEQASPGTVVAIDEFPALGAVASELPSLLQKRLDSPSARGSHLVVAGSSQRMMQGLVLDRSVPLYGRATEILRIEPLPSHAAGSRRRSGRRGRKRRLTPSPSGAASRATGSWLPSTPTGRRPSKRSC